MGYIAEHYCNHLRINSRHCLLTIVVESFRLIGTQCKAYNGDVRVRLWGGINVGRASAGRAGTCGSASRHVGRVARLPARSRVADRTILRYNNYMTTLIL